MSDLFSKLSATHSEMILGIGYKSLMTLGILIASFLIVKMTHRSIHKANDRFKKMDTTFVPILCTSATVVVYGIGLIIVLDIFGVNTTSFIALLGAAGIAIGLALKGTLSNIAAGAMLLSLRPFRKGHYIECGSLAGTVQEINLFTTILKTTDGLYVFAPNRVLWGSAIKNNTRNGKRRMDIVVGISYSDSIDKGFEVFQKLINEETRFLPEPAPKMIVQSLGDSSVNIVLRGWTNIGDFWETYWDLTKKAKEDIQTAGLTIPFPQRDVHLFEEKQS